MEKGILDAPTFEGIQEEALRKRQNIPDLLVFKGLLTKDYFFSLISQALGVERINLNTQTIDEEALHLLNEDVARQKRAIIFGREEGGALLVAMEDPTNLEAIDFLSRYLKSTIRPFLAGDEDLNRGFSLYERKLTQDFKAEIEKSVQESLRMRSHGDLKDTGENLPVVAVVDALLLYAISSRASDAHFEALDDAILVRFRIDGILHEIIRVPKDIHPAIVARIKILARLRVDEHTHAQDGRFRHTVGDSAVDVRVSIIPTFYGEKVEMRLFTSTQKPLSLTELGLFEEDIATLTQAISRSYGMVLITGPTGSGKTTTLYSLMNMLNRSEVNIVTIEDPIEYDMRYVNQMQVNVAAGITFATGLRSILRQDPNIVMVGEIRDGETANIAVQAALTGHLVLSSLHTNDAPTAIPRLMDMAVPPFLIAAVLSTVTAQRLVRKIHVECLESYMPEPEIFQGVANELHELGIDPGTIKLPKLFYHGKGCAACGFTGYVGRLIINETFHVTEKIRKLILGGNFSLDSLRSLARQEGMVTMFEDGLRKVERGLITIEEVFRVIQE